MNGSAIISADGKYRYTLLRDWAIGPRVLWIMLNPSTADANVNDRTIERCIAFSQREGFGSMEVGNLYAYRATDPRELRGLGALEACGPDNDKHLWHMSLRAQKIICAWGANASPRQLALQIIGKAPAGLWCLGKTKSGSPRHPLYLSKHTPLVPFP